MRIVIDISDNYNLDKIKNGSIAAKTILNAVKNGIILPKGHGRLIDADEVTKDMPTFMEMFVINVDSITGKFTGIACNAPTILEADKENIK